MPRVNLKLYSAEGGASSGERTLENSTMMLGRGTDCDWVLDDPDRQLSRHHCEITADATGATVTDHSSNGIFLNGSSDRQPKGEPYRAADGDTFSIGGYTLELRLEADAGADVASAPTPAQSAASQAPATPVSSSALEAFIEGAGLDPVLMRGADAHTLFAAGQLYRQFIDNLHDLLHDRSVVKAQFRAEATLVTRGKANPFKALTPEELPFRILASDSPGYMPADEAVDEAFKDVKRHQMALLSGMHSAVAQLIDRLNPLEVERLLSQRSAMSIMSAGGKKSASWDAYQKYFETVEREVADLDSSQFMTDFRNGYEARLRELENADD